MKKQFILRVGNFFDRYYEELFFDNIKSLKLINSDEEGFTVKIDNKVELWINARFIEIEEIENDN